MKDKFKETLNKTGKTLSQEQELRLIQNIQNIKDQELKHLELENAYLKLINWLQLNHPEIINQYRRSLIKNE